MAFGRKRRQSATDPLASFEEAAEASQPDPTPKKSIRDTDDIEVLRENWLRAAAELDNQRKRAAERTRQAVAADRRGVLSAFLEVYDALDHALAAHEGEDNDWVQGTRATRTKMLDVLRRLGTRPFRSKGEMFDPERHDAVDRASDPTEADGVVLRVIQSGFELRDGSLLRPAKVVVNQLDTNG